MSFIKQKELNLQKLVTEYEAEQAGKYPKTSNNVCKTVCKVYNTIKHETAFHIISNQALAR